MAKTTHLIDPERNAGDDYDVGLHSDMAMRAASTGALLVLEIALTVSLVFGDDARRLEGVWEFEKEVDTLVDGTPVDPPWTPLEGMLLYRADGFMSVNLMPRGRTWTPANATFDELRASVAEGTGYAGRFEVDEKERTVTHIVSVSLDPVAGGQRLVRHYAFEGDRLVLSGEWRDKGEPRLFRVYWKKLQTRQDPAERPVKVLPKPPVTIGPVTARVAPVPPNFRRTADGGTIRTALLSSSRTPWVDWIGFAFSMDGRVLYFRTTAPTPRAHQAPLHEPPAVPFHAWMFGEEVVLYGGDHPTRIVRENGDVYDLVPSRESTTASFFSPSVVLTGYENPRDEPSNPHPEAILDECRRLVDPFEHDMCLIHQAAFRNDEQICAEMLIPERASECRTWLENIRTGHINHP
jgi:hypothetical protein